MSRSSLSAHRAPPTWTRRCSIFNYGLPDIQLKLEFPIKVLREDGSGTAAGAGDLLLGVKWRFLNDERSQLQLGVYPQLLLPTGDRAQGLGEGRPAYVLPLLVQKSWTSGRSTEMSATGGKTAPERAITFTLARLLNGRSASG